MKRVTINRPVRLSPKEMARADAAANWNGKTTLYTIITRPQSDGGVLVAAIDVKTGLPFGPTPPLLLKKGEPISRAVKEILRWIDKMGWDSDMASSSRMRQRRPYLRADAGSVARRFLASFGGGGHASKEAQGRPHLNKEDPGSILGLLHYLLVDKHGLKDLEPDIKALSRKVDRAWQEYRKSE